MKNNIQNPEMQKQLYKHDHPVMYHLKELIISFYLCLGIAGIATLMMGVFHFVIRLEWGDSMLACVGTTLAIFAIWFLHWSFSYKDANKWFFRILAICIAIMAIAIFAIYFAYIRPTYGA